MLENGFESRAFRIFGKYYTTRHRDIRKFTSHIWLTASDAQFTYLIFRLVPMAAIENQALPICSYANHHIR